MKNVWVGTDWHVWSVGHTSHHPYQSVSNIRQLSDSYANDIQVDDVFIYLGDLCDPAVTDLNELKRLVQNIPGYKILVKVIMIPKLIISIEILVSTKYVMYV